MKANNKHVVIEKKQFVETLPLRTEKTEPKIASLQADFGLCEADFLRLKNGDSKLNNLSIATIGTGLGLFYPIIGKIFAILFDNSKVKIESWELYGSIIFILFGIILYITGKCIPNEKKKVLKDIENHFKLSPRTRHKI